MHLLREDLRWRQFGEYVETTRFHQARSVFSQDRLGE